MQSDEWLTPPALLAALGTFDLDPCAPIVRPWPMAKRHFTTIDDGLKQHWGRGRVWCNPPYGRETGRWLHKLADHGHGLALIFARTDTEMFHEYVWHRAHAVLFLRGRIHFHYVDGRRAPSNAGGPSCLVAYGAREAARLAKYKLDGYITHMRTL